MTENNPVWVGDKLTKLRNYAEHIGYLRDRWSDEHEYEDWQEYVESAKKKCPEEWKFVSITRVGKSLDVKFELETGGTFRLRANATKWSLQEA